MTPRFERRSGAPSRGGRSGAGGRSPDGGGSGRGDRRRPGGGSRPESSWRGGDGPRKSFRPRGEDGGRRSDWSRSGDTNRGRDGYRDRDREGTRDRDGGRGRFESGRSESGRFEAGRTYRAGGRDDRPRGDRAYGERGNSPSGRRFDRDQSSGERDRGGASRPPMGSFDRRRSSEERRSSGPRQRPNASRTPEASAATPPPDDLIWGRHATQAALEAGRPIHRIWCTSEMRSAAKFLQLLRDAKASGVLVEEVTWARLGQITGGSVHQGIALQTAAAETLDLDGLIQGCADLGEPPLLLALDGVTDPHNLGAVVRSAEAMGAHGVVLPQRRSAGLTGSVAKVAAGALEHMPVARVVNLNRSLEKLKDAGYRVIGLAAEGDVTLPDVDLDGPLVLVTGSEDQGLSLLTRRHCDQLVRIPLRGITPSLNASVATALCVYEIARRGWMKDIHGQAPSPPISRPRTLSDLAVDTAATTSEASDTTDASTPAAVQREEIDLSMSVEPSTDAPVHFDESVQLST
ncbi:MAG: 23S rRNA (guanosine(2251)-2'-O)-methyltransferase RlmB [Synechococcus sp.]